MEKVEVIKREIATLTEGCEFLSVSTRPEYDCLIKQEDAAVALKKQVEEYFNPDIAKANALHKSLTAKRKALIEPIDRFLAASRRAVGIYLAQEQEKARQQAAALQEQAAKAGIDTSLIPTEAPKADLGSGRTLVQTWTYDIVDEAQVPREYLMLDTAKIQKVVTAMKDKTNIPGIRVRQEASTRRTGK